MTNQNNLKDYRIELKKAGRFVPRTIHDYENQEKIIDPDEVCMEEYDDFLLLINKNKSRGFKTLCARVQSKKLVRSQTDKYYNCELILETPEGEIRAGGDTLVHAWISYLDPKKGPKDTKWSFVRERIAAIEEKDPALLSTFLDCLWSPGNFIFWKKEGRSINRARAGSPSCDRPDCAFENIRRWFENQETESKERLVVRNIESALDEESYQLSDLFVNWTGFVSYFGLEGSFVFDKKVIDLARTIPPEKTDDRIPTKIITFSDEDEFDNRRPGEPDENKPKATDKLNEDYETYLRNSICAIQNRSRTLSRILNS